MPAPVGITARVDCPDSTRSITRCCPARSRRWPKTSRRTLSRSFARSAASGDASGFERDPRFESPSVAGLGPTADFGISASAPFRAAHRVGIFVFVFFVGVVRDREFVDRGRGRIVDLVGHAVSVRRHGADAVGEDVGTVLEALRAGRRALAGAGRIGVAAVCDRERAFGFFVHRLRATRIALHVAAAVAGVARAERVDVVAARRDRHVVSAEDAAGGHGCFLSIESIHSGRADLRRRVRSGPRVLSAGGQTRIRTPCRAADNSALRNRGEIDRAQLQRVPHPLVPDRLRHRIRRPAPGRLQHRAIDARRKHRRPCRFGTRGLRIHRLRREARHGRSRQCRGFVQDRSRQRPHRQGHQRLRRRDHRQPGAQQPVRPAPDRHVDPPGPGHRRPADRPGRLHDRQGLDPVLFRRRPSSLRDGLQGPGPPDLRRRRHGRLFERQPDLDHPQRERRRLPLSRRAARLIA
ncbi:hypothetical protein VARIO8X_60593 [Burkholderiales bacterium 8X]|nr:hypothetical protein VARIO8X_60593 [Burkholderiales bacterium 8X]